MWNLVLTLQFPRDLTQFLGISKGLSFVLSGISRGNVKKKKFQGGGVKKVYPHSPPPPPPLTPNLDIWILSGIAHLDKARRPAGSSQSKYSEGVQSMENIYK